MTFVHTTETKKLQNCSPLWTRTATVFWALTRWYPSWRRSWVSTTRWRCSWWRCSIPTTMGTSTRPSSSRCGPACSETECSHAELGLQRWDNVQRWNNITLGFAIWIDIWTDCFDVGAIVPKFAQWCQMWCQWEQMMDQLCRLLFVTGCIASVGPMLPTRKRKNAQLLYSNKSLILQHFHNARINLSTF